MADQNYTSNFQQFYHLSPITGKSEASSMSYLNDTSSQIANLGFLSQIEQSILRSSSPIGLQGQHEVTINGVKGINHINSLSKTK